MYDDYERWKQENQMTDQSANQTNQMTNQDTSSVNQNLQQGNFSGNTSTYGNNSEVQRMNTGTYNNMNADAYNNTNACNSTNADTYNNTNANAYNNTNTESMRMNNTAYRTNATANGNYQYGNTYPNDFTPVQEKKRKEKRERRQGSGFGKKLVGCAALGLLFGLFAGIGIYFVQYIGHISDQGLTAQNSSTNQIVAEADSTDVAAGVDNNKDVATDNTADDAAEPATSDSVVFGAGDIGQTTGTVTAVVTDVTNVVKEVMPAIVTINNHYTEKYRYFGQTVTNEADASGSGIIVGENDTELLIVTNHHVIADAETLTVQFAEGSEAEASVKGSDAEMDLAVIAVPISSISSTTKKEIAIAKLGDSDALVVGEPAIAIGNALGYGQSVTTGVISALNRTLDMSNGVKGTFIQTDAAINPGNSGGALLNIKGEVIGINSNKIGGSTVEGMGYAIPISAASPIIADLMLKETKSKVEEEERGYLGISGISVTEDVSEVYGMPEGVYIAQVYDGTPAAAAGLQKGDIITKFGDEDITSMDDLQKELQFYAKGDSVKVTVMSPAFGEYTEKTVEIILGDKVSD